VEEEEEKDEYSDEDEDVIDSDQENWGLPVIISWMIAQTKLCQIYSVYLPRYYLIDLTTIWFLLNWILSFGLSLMIHMMHSASSQVPSLKEKDNKDAADGKARKR
jgi:hypothetical protein